MTVDKENIHGINSFTKFDEQKAKPKQEKNGRVNEKTKKIKEALMRNFIKLRQKTVDGLLCPYNQSYFRSFDLMEISFVFVLIRL